MTRLIDADALMEQPVWLCGGWVGDSYAEGYMDALDKVEETVKSAPTIDAVPVVRCKDCKHWDEHSQYGYDSETGIYGNYCMLWTPEDDFYAVETPADGFCFEAERRDDE